MTQSLIRAALSVHPSQASQMSADGWAEAQQMQGERVRLYRDYASGDHRANMTTEMRNLLRIKASGSLTEFNDNYMDVVIQAMADRLQVAALEGTTEADTTWAADLLKRVRFDAMQNDVHEATVRDGDSYVMAYWDNDTKQVEWSHEPAYDGVDGMLVLYDSAMATRPSLAIKIWHLTLSDDGGTVKSTARVNVYYPGKVERYRSTNESSTLEKVSDDPQPLWVGRDNQPLGVPVVHFRNQKAMYDSYGQSAIANAIPLQDALNRMLYSTVMVYELTAFRILIARGFDPGSALTPGMIIKISPDSPLSPDQVADLTALDGADPTPYLAGMQFLVGEIGNVTNTPRLTPQGMGGDNASGESLKQREIGLLGKLQRFQTKAGNAWEDLLKLSAAIQTAFGGGAPGPDAEFTTKWVSAEIRNDTAIVDNALKLKDQIDRKTLLEMLAPLFDWDDAKIAEIMRDKQAETDRAMAQQTAMNAVAGQRAADGSASTPAGARQLADIHKAAGIMSVSNGNGATA